MVNCINLIIEMSPRFILGRENVPYVAEVVNRSLKADCTDYTAEFVSKALTLFIPGFFGWCSTGGVFHLHPVTPLFFKSDDSNLAQNYSGIGSIFWGKKNRDQIDNNVTMTLSLL